MFTNKVQHMPFDLNAMSQEWEQTKASPEWRAMEKMQAGLAAMRTDPEIACHEGLRDVLEALQELIERARLHDDAASILEPLQKHFNTERSKHNNQRKKEKVQAQRQEFDEFLGQQKDVTDTPRLAARLRKAFGIESVRKSEDEVRRWKKTYAHPGA